MRLLLYLLRGSSYVTLILNETDIANIQLLRSVNLLESMKLIQKNVDTTTYPKKNIISLTNRGKQVAIKIRDIENLLNET